MGGFSTVRCWAENNFNWILLSAFFFGLVVPGLEHVHKDFVVYGTGLVIFLACSRLSLKEMESVDLFNIAGFSFLRFMALPFVAYGAVSLLYPDLAIGAFLLMLMPAGVTITVLAAVTGGNVALGLALTLVSSLLAPPVVTSAFAMLGYMVEIDLVGMFQTLCIIVFLPIALYFLVVRRIEPLKAPIRENSKFISIVMMVAMTSVIVAQTKEVFFEDPLVLLDSVLVLSGLFALSYAAGWFLSFRSALPERITYAYGSGAMNNNLGIALAYVYFDEKIALFMVLSEIVWVVAMSFFQTWLKRRKKTLAVD